MAARPLVWKMMQGVARVLTRTMFHLKISGLEHIPEHGGALIVSNHQSYLDPIVLGAQLHRPLSYMAKKELFEVTPAFTWLLRSLGAFPVHNGHSDVRALRESIQRLQEGHLLNIYPEGSRTPDGEIGKIERGMALMERRARVPIIPAVIVGAYEAWSIHRRYPRRWPIRVMFGPPLLLADLTGEEIVAIVDATLRAMFDRLRAEPAVETSNVPPR